MEWCRCVAVEEVRRIARAEADEVGEAKAEHARVEVARRRQRCRQQVDVPHAQGAGDELHARGRHELAVLDRAVEQLDRVAHGIARVPYAGDRARTRLGLGAGARFAAGGTQFRERLLQLERARHFQPQVHQPRPARARVHGDAPLPVVHLEIHAAVGRDAATGAGRTAPGHRRHAPVLARTGARRHQAEHGRRVFETGARIGDADADITECADLHASLPVVLLAVPAIPPLRPSVSTVPARAGIRTGARRRRARTRRRVLRSPPLPSGTPRSRSPRPSSRGAFPGTCGRRHRR